jgi:hypothetical protein
VRRTAAALLALATLAGTLLTGATASAAPAPPAPAAEVLGNDVSWPQCPKWTGVGYGLPMPAKASRFVVIGLTQGRGYLPNPCLRWQVDIAKKRHLWTSAYSYTTFPTRDQLRQYGNAGYAQASYNVATMRRVGLRTPMVWIDVEVSPRRPWSANLVANRFVVEGVVRGYESAGYRVGFYSTTLQWNKIVGAARFGRPEWRTAGKRGKAVAQHRCIQSSFQGGDAVLAQWWDATTDWNLTCPGHGGRTELQRYFRKD